MPEESILGGYILISRKMIESEIFDKPPLYLKVWIYLLSKAQHKKYKKLKRGQLFTNIPEIQEACSWYVGYRKETPSKSQIYRIIDWLRKTGERETTRTTNEKMIETTKATQGMVIEVCNYNYYQNPKNYEQNAERNNEKTTNERRPQHYRNNINKNVKNDKNDNKKVVVVEDAREENQFQEIIQKYQDTFREPITPFIAELFQGYIKDGMETGAINIAIEQAGLNNAKSIKYVQKILNIWLDKGILTKEEAKLAIEQHERRKNNGRFSGNNSRKEKETSKSKEETIFHRG